MTHTEPLLSLLVKLIICGLCYSMLARMNRKKYAAKYLAPSKWGRGMRDPTPHSYTIKYQQC